ncbi:hypothetical protein Daus18300_008249 [Diaporthe australafricana]|uniref:Uncharacterized protein n=1 Tax=Diaporthe australafricana TaxID=127596 RepID=A0ABR3WJ60_9PEZI
MSQSRDLEPQTDAEGVALLSPTNLKNSQQRFMSNDLRLICDTVIDTNAVDKCEGDSIICKYVRLWSTAEFFHLESLQKDTIEAMEDHIGHRIKAISDLLQVFESAAIIKEFFCGVATAYNDFPHAKPCQKALVDYAHAIRFRLYRSRVFTDSIHKFPGLAPDLFLVAVRGTQSKWAGDSEPDYRSSSIQEKCMECKCGFSEPSCWYVDPQSTGGSSRFKEVPWKCEACVEKSGYPWESREST